jgi:aminopeptidase N
MKKGLIVFMLLTASAVGGQTLDSVWKRSILRFEEQDYHGVVEDMDMFLEKMPGNPGALYNKGIALLYLGNSDSACAYITLAQSFGLKTNRSLFNYACNNEYIKDFLISEYYPRQKVDPEHGYRPGYTRADTLRGALRPERTCFDVYYYDLEVKIIPGSKKIKGVNDIYFHVLNPATRIQIDLFDNYTITGITWNGTALHWHREYNAIFIDFPRELIANENQKVTIAYAGKPDVAPNPPWEGGFVWEHDKNKNLWISVACEHLGASSWWPTKDHMTDKPDSMQISLEIPKGYQVVSNGNLREVRTAGKKTDLFRWFVSYPINNYNVTFYIGKYVSFNDTLVTGNDTLRLDYNVLDFNLQRAREHFKQTRDVLRFYNEAFGYYPFPKDGYGLVESSYAGMEHQSAIAYGNGYDNNNDYEYRNQKYDFIIVHESAHEWWGNSVTASDMADMWIHEGFATYSEYLFLEKMFGMDEYLYELTEKSKYIFNLWPLVQNRDVNENTFAGNDVYNKGAMILHCLRCTLNNDSLFFSILKGFYTKYKYQVVNSNDFIRFVNQAAGYDLTPFFDKYLYDTKLPVLAYRYYQENNELVFRYCWTGVETGFVMPFGIETNTKESLRLVADTDWQEIRLPGIKWFNFFTIWKGYEGSRDHSFTYFSTHCENP